MRSIGSGCCPRASRTGPVGTPAQGDGRLPIQRLGAETELRLGRAREYPNQDVFTCTKWRSHTSGGAKPEYREVWISRSRASKTTSCPTAAQLHRARDGNPCYHDLNVVWIARFFAAPPKTGARTLLEKMVNYYPLTYSDEARPEYYTDCWWEHYWSDGAAGPEIIAGLAGDAHNKHLADRLLERTGTATITSLSTPGMFYRDAVKPQPLPDNYVKVDRNIRGPRGRFGSWYFAGVQGAAPATPLSANGLPTGSEQAALRRALLAANVEVGSLDADGAAPASSTSGPHLSARCPRFSGRHPPRFLASGRLSQLRNNRQVPPTPWQATQVWLLTKSGLVGLVELEAAEPKTAGYVGGELRFGPDLPLTKDETGAYHCGAVITMRLLESNFATVEAGPARPGVEIHRTRRSTSGPRARALTRARRPCVTRPSSRPTATIAGGVPPHRVAGPLGFQVRLSGKRFAVAFARAIARWRLDLAWVKAKVAAKTVAMLEETKHPRKDGCSHAQCGEEPVVDVCARRGSAGDCSRLRFRGRDRRGKRQDRRRQTPLPRPGVSPGELGFDEIIFVKRGPIPRTTTTRTSTMAPAPTVSTPKTASTFLASAAKAGRASRHGRRPARRQRADWQISLSFDAKKVVFDFRQDRAQVSASGKSTPDAGLHEVSFPPPDGTEEVARWNLLAHRRHSPCYLPDGDIIFSSTRSEHTVLCGGSATWWQRDCIVCVPTALTPGAAHARRSVNSAR